MQKRTMKHDSLRQKRNITITAHDTVNDTINYTSLNAGKKMHIQEKVLEQIGI